MWKIIFDEKIENKLNIILGKQNGSYSPSEDIYINKIDKENLKFVDNKWKEYNIWKLIKKIYIISPQQEWAIIDAVIWWLLYEYKITNSIEQMYNAYKQVPSCAEYFLDVIKEWLKQFVKNDFKMIYIYNSEETIFWRCIIDEKSKKRGQIYTSDEDDKYAYQFLNKILEKYKEKDVSYDVVMTTAEVEIKKLFDWKKYDKNIITYCINDYILINTINQEQTKKLIEEWILEDDY